MTTAEQVAKVVRSVSQLVRAGRGARAVHLLVQAWSHDGAIRQVDLARLLTRQLGGEKTEALIRAFAAHPCMICTRGLLACEACRGEGEARDGRVCDACAGFGATNCDFCAGSGWITYNCIPASLRAAVVVARCKLALAEAHALLAAPLPDPPKASRPTARKDLAQRLLRLNRLQGAFNNALEVARHSVAAATPTTSAVLKNVEAVCTKAATRLERTIRRLLLLLREVEEVEAARATQARIRESARWRANYYAALAKSSNFTGTCLYHLYLDDLRRRRNPGNRRAIPKRPGRETSG